MDAVTVVEGLDFDTINRQARDYPAYLLKEGGTALALFAAGFHGWNDVVHFARKNMRTTCVDTDAEKLAEMRRIYPANWDFVIGDAFAYAGEALHDGMHWDVVSVDPFLGDAAERAWDCLYLWTGLARDLVTLTVRAHSTILNVPQGWNYSYFPRSESAAWLVMSRA